MTLKNIKPGDLVTINREHGADKKVDPPFGPRDDTFVAWVLDTNVHRLWNEGEREVRIEPVHSNITWKLVSPYDVVGHYPHRSGKRPKHIEAAMRDYDPYDYEGGVIGNEK